MHDGVSDPIQAAYRARLAAGTLEPDPAQAQVVEHLAQLSRALALWKPPGLFSPKKPVPRGLYLFGAVGRGKSMLMDLFFEASPLKAKQRQHFHDFMRGVHQRLRQLKDARERDPLAKLASELSGRLRLLCFDELQVSDIGDAMILGRLFELLLAGDVVIVATSNRPPRDLYKNGINRQLFEPCIELLETRFDVVQLGAARDYRLDRLLAAPIWHGPLGWASEQAMDKAWLDLTQGAQPLPRTLDVDGRALEVRRSAAGIARFTFEELCARPLGPSDYLSLAQAFGTLLVDGIPRLSPEQRDQAKRFVTLIDAMYEAKSVLIASAACAPGELYPAGDGAFEFERTVSRLMEMQSHAYLVAASQVRQQRA